MSQMLKFRALLMRGGTSRALFFEQSELPVDPKARDRVILAALGSPDPYRKQIDGVGGATSSTSKVAILARPAQDSADINFTFGQVRIEVPIVEYCGNCGNISAAVGLYAVEHDYVPIREPITPVRIYSTNTHKLIIAHVPVRNGNPLIEGDYEMDGVPRPGAEIRVDFIDPAGSMTGKLLPTADVCDRIRLAGGQSIEVSVVDAGNPSIFVRARDVGLTGAELPGELNRNRNLHAKLEEIRARVAVAIGLAQTVEDTAMKSAAVPKIAIVAPPATYQTTQGTRVAAAEIDLTTRMVSLGAFHHAYPLTGAIATAAAAWIRGTIVHEMVRGLVDDNSVDTIRIGHSAGKMSLGVAAIVHGGEVYIERVTVSRTARKLMEGWVYVPARVISER